MCCRPEAAAADSETWLLVLRTIWIRRPLEAFVGRFFVLLNCDMREGILLPATSGFGDHLPPIPMSLSN